MELLARTRQILNDGKRWTQNHVASSRLGVRCDPLSSRAFFFSLKGAATRAHWEMRDKLTHVKSWEIRTVDGVDIADPGAVGPARLDVWTRFADAPDEPTLNQALLAFATDGFLIGTAMRPHDGVGQSLAHRSISTSVITHTLTFHGPVDASGWLLLDQESPVARAGRSYGRAHVFSEAGDLVASFVQEGMIRAFAADQAPLPGGGAAL